MLVLSRRVGQSIILNNGEIKIKVLYSDNEGCIRLGFEADSTVLIDREEIYEKKQEEKNAR